MSLPASTASCWGTSVCTPSHYHALSCLHSEVPTVQITSSSVSQTLYDRLHSSGLPIGGNLRVLDWGCRVDRVTLSNKILWWVPESSDLCAALRCNAEARFMLDTCEAKLVWNASWVLSAFWCRHWSWLSPLKASHPQGSLLGSPRTLWTWPCLLAETFWIFFFPGDWGWCHFMHCLVSGSQWWTQVSSDVTVWDMKACPSASKHANNSEEMAFLLVLCSTVRLQGTLLSHTFKYPRSRMMWLTLLYLLKDWVPVV